MAEYIPGVCNIGPEEIKNRRQLGITWSLVSVALLALLFFFNAPAWLRLLVFLPALIAASGLYQAAFKFCAGYGNSGLYNVAKSVGKYDSVEKAEFRAKDKKKAQQIFGLSILTAAGIAIVAFLI